MPLTELELELKYCEQLGIATMADLKALIERKHCATNAELKSALISEYIAVKSVEEA
jgi:hypothetical protein